MSESAPYTHRGDNTPCWTHNCSLRESGYPIADTSEPQIMTPTPTFLDRLLRRTPQSPEQPRYIRTPEGVAFDALSDRLSNVHGLHDYIRENAQTSSYVGVPFIGSQDLLQAASCIIASGGKILSLELYTSTHEDLTAEQLDTFTRRGIELLHEDDFASKAVHFLVVDNWITARGFTYAEPNGRQVTVGQLDLPMMIEAPLVAASH